MTASEMQLNAGETERLNVADLSQSLTTICWSHLIRCDGFFAVSVGQILPGLVREKGGLLL